MGPAPATEKKTLAHSIRRAGARARARRAAALAVTNITVRFGGNTAVEEVSFEVGADEIVGLIGTNGAGKSTLMNAIGGYVKSSGDVEHPRRTRVVALAVGAGAARARPHVPGRDAVPRAHRARDGRARARGPAPHRLAVRRALPAPSVRMERKRRAEADDLIDFLGLGRYADTYISDLSTGTRRIVELAGLLALDARVLCLDEPTAGLAQRETEAFGPVIIDIRRELSASVLVIEHDMPLIMGISDRVYCLELGQIIADGGPERGPQRPRGRRLLPRHRRTGDRPQRRRPRRDRAGDRLSDDVRQTVSGRVPGHTPCRSTCASSTRIGVPFTSTCRTPVGSSAVSRSASAGKSRTRRVGPGADRRRDRTRTRRPSSPRGGSRAARSRTCRPARR